MQNLADTQVVDILGATKQSKKARKQSNLLVYQAILWCFLA